MNKSLIKPDEFPLIEVPTAEGTLRVHVANVNGRPIVVAATEIIPEVPVVRFHSSCIFGEAFHAIDCDCGVQFDAARKLVLIEGGILVYAWEEGRGVGIVDKVRAIAIQQAQGRTTGQAFGDLGHDAEPRTFEDHIAALKTIFSGHRIKLASNNPKKIAALVHAGYAVERIQLKTEMTPERRAYLDHKREHLGHLHDD